MYASSPIKILLVADEIIFLKCIPTHVLPQLNTNSSPLYCASGKNSTLAPRPRTVQSQPGSSDLSGSSRPWNPLLLTSGPSLLQLPSLPGRPAVLPDCSLLSLPLRRPSQTPHPALPSQPPSQPPQHNWACLLHTIGMLFVTLFILSLPLECRFPEVLFSLSSVIFQNSKLVPGISKVFSKFLLENKLLTKRVVVIT